MADRVSSSSEPKEHTTTTAAELLVKQLASSGIQYLFVNGGTDFPPIVEAYAAALRDGYKLPEPMVVPHENAAAAMAYGAYLATGKPQAVMVHVNVGTANAINIALDAGRENIPILLMAGRSPYSETGPDGCRSRYIHWGQEMYDQAGMLREAVKWDYELHMPNQAGDVVLRAMQVAMSSPRGPVYLTLPRDVLAARASTELKPPISWPKAPGPRADDVTAAAKMIGKSKRPIIITSSIGRTEEGFKALDEFSQRFAVPVVSFHPRYLNVSTSNPMHGGYLPDHYVRDADLIVVLECDVPWIPSAVTPKATTNFIHIGEDPSHSKYPMRTFPCDLAIAADCALALHEISRELLSSAILDVQSLKERRETAALRVAAAQQANSTSHRDNKLSAEFISRTISKALTDDAIIVNEYPLILEAVRRERFGTYYGPSPAGGLGWGLGAALGVKLATPERVVVCTMGDGAYMFANPTACHWVSHAHQIPVLSVIFNNQMHGAVRTATLSMYGDGVAAATGARLMADLRPSPEFEKLVTASGGLGIRVETADELAGALQRGLEAVTKERRQALINVIMAD